MMSTPTLKSPGTILFDPRHPAPSSVLASSASYVPLLRCQRFADFQQPVDICRCGPFCFSSSRHLASLRFGLLPPISSAVLRRGKNLLFSSGSAGCHHKFIQHKLILNCFSGCSELSFLPHSSGSFFSSLSSGRANMDIFVRCASVGETEQSYRWPDNKVDTENDENIQGRPLPEGSSFQIHGRTQGRRKLGTGICCPQRTRASSFLGFNCELARICLQKPRICILGGGFGGLYTALRLESLVWTEDKKPQVLLVDQSDKFVFKPMLYELLSGEVDTWEIAPSFTELLRRTSVQFIKDKVKLLRPSDHLNNFRKTGLGCSGGTVLLESGKLVEYDWLVLALGAAVKLDVVPGSAEFAYPFSTLDDAIKVDEKLRLLEREQFSKDSSPINIAIVGCGYSGVELAATISERLQGRGIIQAINVESSICPTASSGNREAALKILSSRNTELLLGYFVSSINEAPACKDLGMAIGTGQEVHVDNVAKTNRKYILELKPAQKGLQSQIREADLVLWTVGSKPIVPELDSFGQPRVLPLNGRGQAEIDGTLQVRGHPRIFAIGDSAAMRDSSGKLLPATAQVAFQQADFTGWNLWAAINDRPLLPFSFQNLGEMMTLGKNDGAVSPSFFDGLTLDGPIGHTARKLIYLWRLPTDEHRLKVGFSWLTKSVVESVASLQTAIANVFSGP